MTNPRLAAYNTLLQCEKDGLYSNIAVDHTIRNSAFDKRDSALYTNLVYGVISRKKTLDYIIASICEKNPKRLDKSVLVLLRLGIYQIKYCSKIPVNSSVDETVKLASRYASRAKGFINAILRKAISFELDLSSVKDNAERLSVKYSVSTDIARLLIKDYGSDAESILSSLEKEPPVTVAVNPLKTSISEMEKRFPTAIKGKYSPLSLVFSEKEAVAHLEEMKNGYITVQDQASQIAVCALEAEKGMTVVDTCSCPGGKSFFAAFCMQNEGEIYSFDLHENKLSLISSGAQRLGISIIKTATRDATVPDPSLFEKADRVICDVPCSGIGVIAKKPDLRYKEKNVFDELPDIQYKILCESSKYLKPGGILIYSTCTLYKKENEENVKRFLNAHPEFSLYDFKSDNISSENGMLTLRPDIHETDGFFIARFRKKDLL